MTDCLTGLFFVGSQHDQSWKKLQDFGTSKVGEFFEPGRGLSEEEAKMLLELELLAETSNFEENS